MEALEKDFQELVASEDSTVEDEIIQGILEPTVAEEEVLDDETEEILAEDEDAWEEPDQDDLEFFTEVIAVFAKPITLPFNCSIADMKLSLVLVEGSKNKVDSILSLSKSGLELFSINFAIFKI